MSEYRRFFSYIYAYEDHQKTANTGFAKIEMKGTMTTIELHMHGCKRSNFSANLYLFVRKEQSLLGFALGDVPFCGGNADRRFTLGQANINGSSYGIQDVAGIVLIADGQICFVSQWDEAPINWSAFTVYTPPQSKPNSDTSSNGTTTDKDPMPSAVQTPDKPAAQPARTPSTENTIQSAELPLTQPRPSYQNPAETVKKIAGHIPTKNSWSEMWAALMDSYPHVQPFTDGQIKCVRVELKDLRLLPPSNWHLCNNSFLLHSFFIYRHLIFGQFSSARGSKWFIGVPGIRYRQEHVLAAIFGFSDFLPDKESANADAPFGYWYMAINESD